MPIGGIPRGLAIGLGIAGLTIGGLAVLALVAGVGSGTLMLVVLAALAGIGGLWVAFVYLEFHFRALAHFGHDLDLVAATGAVPRRWHRPEHAAGIDVALARAAMRAMRALPQGDGEAAWLAGILGALPLGVVVFTETGLVSMANAAARHRLGYEATTPGHSVFALVGHAPLAAALADAASGTAATVDFSDAGGGHVAAKVTAFAGGGMLSFAADDPGPAAQAADTLVDLSVHQRPPSPAAYDDATPLEALPLVSLDLETTGLDVTDDRIVSVGAVRLDGDRIYYGAALDRLVAPGVTVPERAVRVHGLNDDVLAGAPALADQWHELAAYVDGCIVIGHQIGFDLAMLRAEARRHGLPPIAPPALDTMALYQAIAEDEALSLDAAAASLGIDVFGRHTALGDAIVTAELFRAMRQPLAGRGIVDWAGARAAATPPRWT